MQYRDALISSLTLIARRMRLRAALRELTWAACALASTLLVYQILAALIPALAVASALKALLVLLFIGSIGVFAVRGARRITLAQAAAATDASADLKEGCLSAPGEFLELAERVAWVVVKFQDETGKEFIKTFDGIWSVCIQHELSHLEGESFLQSKSLKKSVRKMLAKKWELK